MPVPDFSPGEVLTASAMDSIGLWLVKTQTVGTAVSSVPVSGAFSNNFANYRIIISTVDFSANGESVLLTLSGVSGSVYKYNLQYSTYAAAGFTGTGSGGISTGFLVGYGGSTDNTNLSIDLYNPQLQKQTGFTSSCSSETFFTVAGGICTSTVQSTDFTVTAGAGTMTGGTIRVYGYRN